MKSLYLMFLILLLKFSCPIQAAHPWYWKAFGGINYFNYDHEYHPVKSDNGYIVGASLGRRIVPCVSLEAELAFRRQKLSGRWRDRYSYPPSFDHYSSKHTTGSLLANAVVDIPIFLMPTPYVGAGAGCRYDYVDGHIDFWDHGREKIHGGDWNGAYQVLGGIKFKLVARLQTFVEYRYFDLIKENCPGSGEHSVTVGIGRSF